MEKVDAAPGLPVIIDDYRYNEPRIGILVSPKLDDNYWTVEHADGISSGDTTIYHISKLCIVG